MDIEKIRTVLLERRLQKKLSAKELADKVGVNKTTIYRYEKGQIEKMPLSVVNRIAKVLEINPEFIIGFSDNPNSEIENIFINETVTILNKLQLDRKKNVLTFTQNQLQEQEQEQGNVITHDFSVKKIVDEYENDGTENVDIAGEVAAGYGSFNEDKSQPIKTVSMNENDVPYHYDLAFEVSGDSMYPTFQDKEIIFVKKTTEVTNGMIGCIEINEEAFIKKMYIEDNRLRLVSLNNDYDDYGNRLYPDFYADETDNLYIIGKVIN